MRLGPAVFQPARLTNGALASAKQQGPEGRTGPASLCLSVCLPACLPVCLSGCLSVCLSVCLSLSLSVSLSLCVFVCLCACLSVCLSACLSAYLPACLPGWLAGWLSVCLSLSLSREQSSPARSPSIRLGSADFLLLGRYTLRCRRIADKRSPTILMLNYSNICRQFSESLLWAGSRDGRRYLGGERPRMQFFNGGA